MNPLRHRRLGLTLAEVLIVVAIMLVLGARPDGFVGWHPYWDDWQFEIASVALSRCP